MLLTNTPRMCFFFRYGTTGRRSGRSMAPGECARHHRDDGFHPRDEVVHQAHAARSAAARDHNRWASGDGGHDAGAVRGVRSTSRARAIKRDAGKGLCNQNQGTVNRVNRKAASGTICRAPVFGTDSFPFFPYRKEHAMLQGRDPRPGSSTSHLPPGYRIGYDGVVRRPDNSVVSTCTGRSMKAVGGKFEVPKK